MRAPRSVPWILILLATALAVRGAASGTSPSPEEELAPPPSPEEELAPPPPPREDELAPPPPKKDPAKTAPVDASAWVGVKAFRGIYESRRVDGKDRQSTYNLEIGETVAVSSARFVLQLPDVPGSEGIWRIKEANVIGSVESHSASHRPSFHGTNAERGTYSQAITDLTLTIDRRTGRWRFDVGGQLPQPFVIKGQLRSRSQSGGAAPGATRTGTTSKRRNRTPTAASATLW